MLTIRRRITRALRALVSLVRRRPILALAGLAGAGVAVVAGSRALGLGGAAPSRALPDLGGGAESAPDMFAGVPPAAALAQIQQDDLAFYPILPSYARALDRGGRRYPIRQALIRAAVKASSGAPVAGFPPLVSPDGTLAAPWAFALALYDARAAEWSVVASEIDRWEAPAPGWFDTLRGLVSAASAAASGNIGPALRALAPRPGSAPSVTPPNRYAAWDADERALLAALRKLKVGDFSAQDMLSGRLPLYDALKLIAGKAGLTPQGIPIYAASRIRLAAAGSLSPAMSALDAAALILKAVILSRRWPTPGITRIGEWAQIPPPPAAPGAAPPVEPRPVPGDQSSGGGFISDQSSGGGFIGDQSSGGGWP